MGMLRGMFIVAAACCAMFASVAASADGVGWTDISAAIAAREAAWASATVPADSGSYDAGTLGAVEDSAEFVAGGRVFDTFFWHEAFSAFVGIAPKNRPGFLCIFY